MGGLETTKSCLAWYEEYLFPSDELRRNFCLFVEIEEIRNYHVPSHKFQPPPSFLKKP